MTQISNSPIKSGRFITADNLGKTFVDTKQNKIFINSTDEIKFAVVDAFAAAKVDPTERLQEAAQTQEQQAQEQAIQLAQQMSNERGGLKLS